jgi:hypothetical protein
MNKEDIKESVSREKEAIVVPSLVQRINDCWYMIIGSVKAHSRLTAADDLVDLVWNTFGSEIYTANEIEALLGYIEKGRQKCMEVMAEQEKLLRQCYEESMDE